MTTLVAEGRYERVIVPAHGAEVVIAPSRARAFHTLDALRGVAALAVLLFHAAPLYGIKTPAEGQIAVDLFFVMSGFIIAFRYDRDFAHGLKVAAFLKVRLVRLYPLFLLGLVLGILIPLIATMVGRSEPLLNAYLETFGLGLFMLPSTLVLAKFTMVYPLNYVAWSLTLEILVNIAYAATFRFWTIRRLMGFVGVASVGLLMCAIHYGTLNIGFDWDNSPGGLARILFGFPMGVLLFRLYDRAPFTRGVPWWVLIVGSLGMFFFDAPFGKVVWELFAVIVLVPLIVAAAVAREPPRVLQPACAMAGVISYVLYSLHAPFIGLFLRAETEFHLDPNTHTAARSLVFSLLIVALCIVAHAAYDRPARRWLTRATRPRLPAAHGAGATKN